jgi:hypothetical protein
MTKDEEEELLELLRDAYDIIEALTIPSTAIGSMTPESCSIRWADEGQQSTPVLH